MARRRSRVLMKDQHAVVHSAQVRNGQNSTPLKLVVSSGIEHRTVADIHVYEAPCFSLVQPVCIAVCQLIPHQVVLQTSCACPRATVCQSSLAA